MRKSIEKELINSISDAILNHLLLFRHYKSEFDNCFNTPVYDHPSDASEGMGGVVKYDNLFKYHCMACY